MPPICLQPQPNHESICPRRFDSEHSPLAVPSRTPWRTKIRTALPAVPALDGLLRIAGSRRDEVEVPGVVLELTSRDATTQWDGRRGSRFRHFSVPSGILPINRSLTLNHSERCATRRGREMGMGVSLRNLDSVNFLYRSSKFVERTR
jgi:hypothetical protein